MDPYSPSPSLQHIQDSPPSVSQTHISISKQRASGHRNAKELNAGASNAPPLWIYIPVGHQGRQLDTHPAYHVRLSS